LLSPHVTVISIKVEMERKITIAVNHVKMEDEDILDVEFWLNRSPSERLAEVFRLRRDYFTRSNRSFPLRIEKVVHQKKCNF
jgi:hypothetical protein